MKYSEVSLIPLKDEDIDQFILDNQRSFSYGAMVEFGLRDDHVDDDGEIISRQTIIESISSKGAEAYRIMADGEAAGGVVIRINNETYVNDLDILFVNPEMHSRGIGYGAWSAVEKLHPETKVWETCTPYFDKRNIHFYVNKCGFKIDEFWCGYFKPSTEELNGDPDEGPDEMFHFIKVMQD